MADGRRFEKAVKSL